MCIFASGFSDGIDFYGVSTFTRLLKIIGLVCRISSLLQDFFAKETYNLKEPTTCSQSIFGIYSHLTDVYSQVSSLL